MAVLHSIFVETWPWWIGGIVIGLLVPGLYYFLNTALGVSTGYGNLVKMLMPRTKLRWLNTEAYKKVFNWRFFFMTGMIIGAFISARTMGLNFVNLEMGLFTKSTSWSWIAYAIYFFAGGFLLGLGSRIAGGCTSGHSIHGLANFHLSSLVATFFFILFGFIT